MNINNLLDLYTDYLLATPTYSTTTGLSAVTDNQVSHDQITRLLSNRIDSQTLWQFVKPMIGDISDSEGLLIIDDSIEAKQRTKANDYDHLAL